jgi:hypothetical protein
MQTITFLPMLLTLFDGGAAAAGAGEGAGAQGETQAAPGNTRRGKSGETILYGKQPSVATEDAATSAPAAGESTKEAQVKTTSNTLEERRKAYFDLINSEDYKDIHTQESQRMINRRFSETKNLQQQVDDFSPVKDILMQRYKVEDGDMGKLLKALENDDKYWSEAAEEQGLTVDQYKRIQQMERQLKESNLREQRMLSQQRAEQQMQKWDAEAQTLKGIYQNFDIHTEAQNPQFMSLLRSGVPMQTAYEVIHMDDIKAGIQRMTASATEKQVTDNIRAKGQRPAENGTSSQSAFTVKDDVSKLSKADRRNIAVRSRRGESISF